MKHTVLFIALIIAVLLAACALPNGGPAAGSLEGSWTLTSMGGKVPIDGSTTTIKFENGEAGGKSGCNSYGGSYTISGNKLAFSALMQTEMACMEPQGLMEQESAYLQSLSQTASFSAAGDQLELKNAAGEVTLVFSKD
jgi:heat shock protein HslJ